MLPRISLIPFDGPNELRIVRRIVTDEGRILESRPEILEDGWTGCAAYVWRMVMFTISPNPKFQCLPVGAFDYIPVMADAKEREMLLDWLDALTNKVLEQIPRRRWHGIIAWRSLSPLHGIR